MKMSEFAKVGPGIRKSEDHQRTLTTKLCESFSGTLKLDIILEMVPKQVHDFVLQTLGNDVKYLR